MSSPTPIHDMVHHHTSTTSTPGVSHDTALSGGTGLLPTPFAFFGTQHGSRPSFGLSFGQGRASMGRFVNRGFQGGRFPSNSTPRPSVVPECQIFSKHGHTGILHQIPPLL